MGKYGFFCIAGVLVAGLSSAACAAPNVRVIAPKHTVTVQMPEAAKTVRIASADDQRARAEEEPSAEWQAKFVRPCVKSGNRLSC